MSNILIPITLIALLVLYFCFLKLLSSDSTDKAPVRLPEPGEIWALSLDDPFPPKYFCRIIDVKDGWVRYALGEKKGMSSIFEDERKPIKNFTDIYKFHSKPQ